MKLFVYIRVVLEFVFVAVSFPGLAQEAIVDPMPSRAWDNQLLNVNLGNVRMNTEGITLAWQEMTTKYLIRANLYLPNRACEEQSVNFAFKKQNATVRELLDAFVVAYPKYTYTQDKECGIIWIHPKTASYSTLLSWKVNCTIPINEAPMYTSILVPLCNTFAPRILLDQFNDTNAMSRTFDNPVSVSSGIHTVKDILNSCCSWNIARSFYVCSNFGPYPISITPVNLHRGNPLAVFNTSLAFWECAFGPAPGGLVSEKDIIAGMSYNDPNKRWAARSYYHANDNYYLQVSFQTNAVTPEEVAWATIGVDSFNVGRNHDGKPAFIISTTTFKTNFIKVTDPRVALVTSLSLAKLGQQSELMDQIATHHKYAPDEFNDIISDVRRLGRLSKAVRAKMPMLKASIPELQPILRELETTNFFELAPSAKN
jgi:hypothetical protein